MSELTPHIEKKIAIEELKESLQLLEDTFLESLTDSELEVFDALTAELSIEHQPYDLNTLSPTPGDPYVLSSEGIPYMGAAELLMVNRLHEQSIKAELTLADYNAIENEIITQHQLQSKQNTASIARLLTGFRTHKETFKLEEVELIEKLRAGLATTDERVKLLMAHPEMESIEDMKYTCPLDIRNFLRAIKRYNEQLMEIEFSGDNVLHIEPTQHLKSKSIETDKEMTSEKVIVLKSVIREISSDTSTVVLELVERKSYFVFKTKPQMRGIAENIFYAESNGVTRTVNLQPISVSTYLRVKKDHSTTDTDIFPEVPANEQESMFDVTKLALWKNNIRTSIDDLDD